MLQPTVLLVDDDDSTRGVVAYALRSRGYRVIEAVDAVQALQSAAQFAGPIPILLTDIAMPGLTGVELARRVRSRRPETNVLYMTAYAQLAGMSPVLRKPFTPEELLAAVQAVFPAGQPRVAGQA